MRKYPALHRAMVDVLRDVRIEQGLSQETLSERLGEVHNYINVIENKQHGVSFTEFVAIAEALDVDPVRLMRRVLKTAGPRALLRRK
jgi:transcriptional regulator with XRE-family HTH domain